MSNVPENIERLVVRKLDLGLTDDEQVALDRAVLRSPEVRQMLEDYVRIDASAADALGECLGGGVSFPPAAAVNVAAGPVKMVQRYSRWWWALPATAAAALALTLVPRDRMVTPGAGIASRAINSNTAVSANDQREFRPSDSTAIQQAGTMQPSRRDRSINQDVYYVVGEDGKIYLLERQHVQQFTRPGSRAHVRPAGGM